MFGPSKAQRDAEFTSFVNESQHSLTGTAWLLTGNRPEAGELVQAALVKVYVAWPKVRHDDALAYARRILVNENIDRWRKGRPEVLDDDSAGSLSNDDASDEVVNRDEANRLLDVLPPPSAG